MRKARYSEKNCYRSSIKQIQLEIKQHESSFRETRKELRDYETEDEKRSNSTLIDQVDEDLDEDCDDSQLSSQELNRKITRLNQKISHWNEMRRSTESSLYKAMIEEKLQLLRSRLKQCTRLKRQQQPYNSFDNHNLY